jgi:hypothetical protein
MEKKRIEKEEDTRVKLSGMEYFMSDVFNNYLITKNHIETKINWLLGISGVIMTFSIPLVIDKNSAINHFSMLVICFSAFICFLVCLISLELPDWTLKTPHRDGSVMFYNTKKLLTPEDIHQQLSNIQTQEDILAQYSINIYNVVERNIKVKNRIFKGAGNILFAGLIMGFIVILISVFV